jgi:hypothetical protein
MKEADRLNRTQKLKYMPYKHVSLQLSMICQAFMGIRLVVRELYLYNNYKIYLC